MLVIYCFFNFMPYFCFLMQDYPSKGKPCRTMTEPQSTFPSFLPCPPPHTAHTFLQPASHQARPRPLVVATLRPAMYKHGAPPNSNAVSPVKPSWTLQGVPEFSLSQHSPFIVCVWGGPSCGGQRCSPQVFPQDPSTWSVAVVLWRA